MPPKPRILVIGSANVDFVTKLKRLPNPDETIFSEGPYLQTPGGKGINTAVCAKRLGADALLCTRVGADNNGMLLRKCLSEENLDIRYVKIDKKFQTGFEIMIYDENDCLRTINHTGANFFILPADVEDAFTCYPDCLVLDFDMNYDTVLCAIKSAAEMNIPVIADACSPFCEENAALQGDFEIFILDEKQAYFYTGIKPVNADSFLKICIDLYNKISTKFIVLLLEDKGAYIYDGLHYSIIPSFYVRRSDLLAAKDSFTASLAYEYLRSSDIISAVKYANAVFAITSARPGTLSSLPENENLVLSFIKNGGNFDFQKNHL